MQRSLDEEVAAPAAQTESSRRTLLKGLGTIGALAGVGMVASASPASALPASRNSAGAIFFVTISGDAVGNFGGTERRNGRNVNEAFGLQIDDISSGAGAQRQRAVAFRMPVGLSTVLLTRAADLADRLQVIIDVTADGDPAGDSLLRFELTDALIGDLRTVINEPADGDPSALGLFNEIELEVSTISVEHVPTGTVVEV